MKGRLFSIILILNLFLVSCDKENLLPKDYLEYVSSEESGLLQHKEINGFEFEVLYEPIAYKALRIVGPEGTKEEFQKSVENMEGLQYYVLKIKQADSNQSILRHNIKTLEEYQNRLAYFSYAFKNNLYIEENGEFLPCELFHFERAYDLSPITTFVLGFSQKLNAITEDKKLVIDSDFFNYGKVKISIKGKDLEALPHVIINP